VSFLSDFDVVIKSPGISRYLDGVKYLEQKGVQVVGGMGLFLEEAEKKNTILVTGTKGKSTTTSLITHLLNEFNESAHSFGNLGFVPWDQHVDLALWKWKILEVSSFQISDLWSSGPVVVVTALSPDHLDWHNHNLETYYRDKLQLCRLPGVELVIANGDDENLREHARLLGEHTFWVHYDNYRDKKWLEDIPLQGVYNKRNVILAVEAIVKSGVNITQDAGLLSAALQRFQSLPHRLEKIAELEEIEFIDDGLATNALPTVAALETYHNRPVALIVGGSDRGIEYGRLAGAIQERTQPICLLALPDVGARIVETVLSYRNTSGFFVKDITVLSDGVEFVGSSGAKVTIHFCAKLSIAVRESFFWAKQIKAGLPTGSSDLPLVLLSPAAPSFSQYHDYVERSKDFKDQVMLMAEERKEL
jgi:UDP-N-acetylmuramoylalanine--D-glutamate ligase